ncbi:MAG: outer membrane beta-barrel protein [Oricola sp.]
MKRMQALGAALLCLVGMQASAADLDGVFIDDANFAKPAELGSGWYIRGDIGLNLNGNQDVSIYGNPTTSTYLDNNYTDGFYFDAGVGYRFNEFLRLDAVAGRLAGTDYATSQLMYEDAVSAFPLDPLAVQPTDPNPCNGLGLVPDGLGGTVMADYFIDNCIDQDSVRYDATYAMANVYADLGKFWGFTPFVGAGIGIGRVAWRQETDSVLCVPTNADVHVEGCQAFGVADQPALNTPYTQPGTVTQGVDYRLGYSLAAGVGYAVNPNTTVEFGYRYMNFGASLLSTGGTTGAGLSANGYGTHQINVGLRYAIW